jgi:hypothetical protein
VVDQVVQVEQVQVKLLVIQVVLEAQQVLVYLLHLRGGLAVVVAELLVILAQEAQEDHQLEVMVLPALVVAVAAAEEMLRQINHQLLHILTHQVLAEAFGF